MNRLSKINKLASALLLGFSLAACGGTATPEHDHTWDAGEVTKEATCHSEGVKTYHCTFSGCKQTKEESITMTPHNWDAGVVTTQPTCNKTGIKTYTCLNDGCGKTKVVDLPKSDHHFEFSGIAKVADLLEEGKAELTCVDCGEKSAEPIPAHADFSEQFGKTKSNWVVGTLPSFDASQTSLEPAYLELSGSSYSGQGVEVGKDQITSSAVTVIGYRFASDVEFIKVGAEISFKGEKDGTRLASYLVLADQNGTIKDCVSISDGNNKDWHYICEKDHYFPMSKGDVLFAVFANKGNGDPKGEFSFVLTPDCVHVWDEGHANPKPTCLSEGTFVYTCLLCGETHSHTMEKVDHDWNDGEVVKEPSASEKGIRRYTCSVCGTTKDEPIAMLPHTIGNFHDDFTTEGSPAWLYGYATNYNFGTNNFTFTHLPKAEDGAWVGVDGLKIANDFVMTEAEGKDLAVGYMVPDGNDTVKVDVDFVGSSQEETRLSARILLVGKDNRTKSATFIAEGQNSANWNTSMELEVESGDKVYVILFREGAGYYHGKLQILVTGVEDPSDVPGPGPEPVTGIEIGNYLDDFSTDGDNSWVYGYATDYNWDNDNFAFHHANRVDENEWSGGEGLVIKKDWFLSEAEGKDLAVGYVVPEGNDKINFAISFNGKDPEETRFSARVLVVDSVGQTKSCTFLDSGLTSAAWDRDVDLEVEAGDIVYMILFKEKDGWRQGDFQIIVTGQTAPEPGPGPEPVTGIEIGNYLDDFSTNGDNSWVYGYATDYNWDTNNFTFNAATRVDENEFSGGEGLVIKKDWFLSEAEGKDLAVGYVVPEGNDKINFAISFNGKDPEETRFSARVLVVDSVGQTKSCTFLDSGLTSAAWDRDVDLEVEAGDIVYMILFKESDGWRQGDFQIVFTEVNE